jgi:hypothetical protein
MDGSLNKENPEVRLRAFRAIDEPETCGLFIEGHTHVLTSIGVTKVSYSKNEWVNNHAVFVMVVESLPIEQATGAMDKGIFELVWKYAQHGTGELCGLWNSREIAGYGVGSIFLIRAAVAISYQIGIQSLFALCAPYTVKPVEAVGMQLEPSIGHEGTFYYPKLDLVATTMLLKDVPELSKANEDEKNAITKIRENLNTVRVEELRGKKITIHYETQIPNLDKWDLKQTIVNAEKNLFSTKTSYKDWNPF